MIQSRMSHWPFAEIETSNCMMKPPRPAAAASIWFEIFWGSWVRVKKFRYFQASFRKILLSSGNFTKKIRFFQSNFLKKISGDFKKNRFSRQKLAIYSYM